ncbi:helix-turn-helix transcriptional regulator [Bifidobacterium sp. 64T4]|nr:helix-turn-helix transcriptional regulator [Bifidobacterium pongonis]
MWSDEEHGAQIALRTETKASEQQEDTLSLRGAIGLVLRDLRSRDHKTLREVSEKAGVSLGYLSEVERGQKEASSELLSSIAEALGVSTAQLLRMVADRLDMAA